MKQFICVFVLVLVRNVQSIYMRMNDGINKLTVNSSLNNHMFSMSLTSYGSHNSSFYIQSPILSSETGRHLVTHSLDQEKLIFDPPLKQQKILFNQYDKQQINPDSKNGQFWFTYKHRIQENEKQFNFITFTVSEDRRSHIFLLPAFAQPFSFLPAQSFYRCQDVLISVSQIDHYLDVSVFTHSVKDRSWNVKGEWDWSMKSTQKQLSFGRHIRFDKDQKIIISLSENKICQFIYKQLPQISHNQQIWRNKAYTVQQILKQAKTIQTKNQQNQDDL